MSAALCQEQLRLPSGLQQALSNPMTRLFADTCSLLEPEAQAVFLSQVLPAMKRYKQRLIIATKVRNELDKHTRSEKLRNESLRAKELLKEYSNARLLDVKGSSEDPFADNLFQHVFTLHRLAHPLVLITQDIGLTADILNLNHSNSVQNIMPIEVYRIKEGKLVSITLDTAKRILETRNARNRQTLNSPYRAVSTVKQFSDTPLPASTTVIETGVKLQSRRNGAIILGKRLGSGGEGAVYETSIQGKVAKIYNARSLTKSRWEKVTLMVEKGLPVTGNVSTGICWPEDLLLDNKNCFRGFLMKSAAGKPLGNAVFGRKQLEISFPNWTRENLARLAISIMEKIVSLHSANVLLGDINPNNILVKDENTVFFIDTDSYQLEGFPSPVSTVDFTPPELQNHNLAKIIRTQANESFAIATLLFMLFHGGKQPYAHQGGGDPAQNIRDRSFPYPFQGHRQNKAPLGPWQYIWSHMPYALKEAFFKSFTGDAAQRVEPQRWVLLLNHYSSDLRQGYHSREMFPNEFKKLDEKVKRHYGIHEEEGRNIKCWNCGQDFFLTKKLEDKIKSEGKKPSGLCKNCRALRALGGKVGNAKTLPQNRYLNPQSLNAIDPAAELVKLASKVCSWSFNKLKSLFNL